MGYLCKLNTPKIQKVGDAISSDRPRQSEETCRVSEYVKKEAELFSRHGGEPSSFQFLGPGLLNWRGGDDITRFVPDIGMRGLNRK
jgi:hypothetical protein